MLQGSGDRRAGLAVSDGSPNVWGQATSPHDSEGHRVSQKTPRMEKTHKDLETGSGVNNPSWYSQALIMQTTDKHGTGTNMLSVNHANTQILMRLFFRTGIS